MMLWSAKEDKTRIEETLTSVVSSGKRALSVQGCFFPNGAHTTNPVLIDDFVIIPRLLINIVLFGDSWSSAWSTR